MNVRRGNQDGFAMISTMLLIALLLSIMVGYWAVTRIEQSTTMSTMDSFRGFYAAEAGLNLRAEAVRSKFLGYSLPAGTSPSDTDPCIGSNQGSGDFACVTYGVLDRDVIAYLEAGASARPIVIARGEEYQNLQGEEYQYVVHSRASNTDGSPEALLEMHFKSRLVPLFQFAAFYNKDLEVLVGSATLDGPVHSNGDLYLGSGTALAINSQVTTAGTIYNGRKHSDTCPGGAVTVVEPDDPLALTACSGTRLAYGVGSWAPWNGMIISGLDALTVPTADIIDPVVGKPYWSRADLRIMLDMSTTSIQVMDSSAVVDAIATAALGVCGSAAYSTSFRNNRETSAINMLDVDLESLLDCIHSAGLLGVGKGLDDDTDDGLVIYLGVSGANMAVPNNYGVRVSNADTLASSIVGAPAINGLTLVSNQALYLWGDFNTVNKKPAAALADTINFLSNSWTDAYSGLTVSARNASDTAYWLAMMAGTDTTGGADGTAGQDIGGYSGGLAHFPRLHENWTGHTITYRGSFVSLNTPRHVDGAIAFDGSQFTEPARDWNFDTDFLSDPNLLPPLPPEFVYLRQELFVRHFEL